MNHFLRPALIGTAAAALLFQAQASAQIPCGVPDIGPAIQDIPAPQAGLTEVWVDPINGNDATGAVNNGNLPYQTASTALADLATALNGSGGPSAANRGLLHLGAGIYSAATNGEVFPITMLDFVDVQGVGAKQTVLRGGAVGAVDTFLPRTNASCDCGVRVASDVLVDFSLATDPSYDEMIDAVTFQGADVQVYGEANQQDLDGRVSNCIFDLLDNPAEGYDGPLFGVLMVHTFQGGGIGEPKGKGEPAGETGGGQDYNDVRFNIFNNTFIQTWDPMNGTPVVSALDESVAICDVNDPQCAGPNPDPDTTLRGVGNPNIQNNLIRAFDATPPTALLGIDDSDVTCLLGTRVGATNAFDPMAVGGVAAPNAAGEFFCSAITGAFPTVVTDAANVPLNPNGLTTGQDPAFVGEANSFFLFLPRTHARDWRLIPSSNYVDQGSSPDAAGILQAVNGTLHLDLACSPQSSFDFDGEYWGNPRLENSPLLATANMEAIDIGYDEVSILIDAGTANDSVVHAGPTTVVPEFGPFLGTGDRMLIAPMSDPTVPDFYSINGRITPLATFFNNFTAYTHFPGSQIPPTTIGIFPNPFDILWLDPGTPMTPLIFVFVGFKPLSPIPYTSPYDGSVQGFSLDIAGNAFQINQAPSYFAEQAIYLPASGPNAGQLLLSNMQGVHD